MAKNSAIIPLHWPGETGRSSIRVSAAFADALDDVIAGFKEDANITITRNDLIMNAVQVFLAHLYKASSLSDLLKRFRLKDEQIERILMRKELMKGINGDSELSIMYYKPEK